MQALEIRKLIEKKRLLWVMLKEILRKRGECIEFFIYDMNSYFK
jgi:hypothetical protein